MGLIHNAALRTVVLGRGLTQQTETWRNAIYAGGASVGYDTVRIVDRFLVRPLIAAGLWDKCYMIDPCVGNSIDASLYRLKVPSGVARKASTGGFLDADMVERGASGGRSGNGSSKYIDTLINPSALSFSTSSFMMWAYTRTALPAATTRQTCGNLTGGTDITMLGWTLAGTVENVGVAGGTAQYAAGSLTSLTGFLGGGTNGTRANQFYQNGIATGATGTGSGSFANNNIYAHAVNNNGTPGNHNNRGISSMIFTQGLSSGEISTLNQIVQAFETALGRNV